MTDDREHAAAVKGLLTAAVAPWSAYDYDEVPGTRHHADPAQRTATRPAIYLLLTVERRGGIPRRGNGRVALTGWRLTVRGVGTTIDEARWALWKAGTALENTALLIDGRPTTPVALESTQTPEPDDGLFSGLSLWTYAH